MAISPKSVIAIVCKVHGKYILITNVADEIPQILLFFFALFLFYSKFRLLNGVYTMEYKKRIIDQQLEFL